MVDCTILPPWGVTTYTSTCTWYSTISTTENDIVPLGADVITRARVRVGSHTGPMQLAVGHAQLDRNKESGHQLPVLRVAGNGTRMHPATERDHDHHAQRAGPVVRDFQSNQDEWDNLALSVLAPGVPIPAAPAGAGGLNITLTAGACWPAVHRGNAYCAPGGPGRYAVLFNADWQANLAVKLAAQFAPVRNNAASAPLTCRLMHKCAGLLRLQNATVPGARIVAAAGKTVTYESAKSTIATGKRKTITIKLSTQGRALLRKHKKVTVGPTPSTGAVRHRNSSAQSSRSNAEHGRTPAARRPLRLPSPTSIVACMLRRRGAGHGAPR